MRTLTTTIAFELLADMGYDLDRVTNFSMSGQDAHFILTGSPEQQEQGITFMGVDLEVEDILGNELVVTKTLFDAAGALVDVQVDGMAWRA